LGGFAKDKEPINIKIDKNIAEAIPGDEQSFLACVLEYVKERSTNKELLAVNEGLGEIADKISRNKAF